MNEPHEVFDDGDWIEWPRCPDCDLKRLVACPFCDVAGRHLRLAEYLAPPSPLHQIGGAEAEIPLDGEFELLLMCDTCDEPFGPRFYSRCEQCGFDFGNGIVIEEEEEQDGGFTNRALAVMIGLVVLAVVAAFYFNTILK